MTFLLVLAGTGAAHSAPADAVFIPQSPGFHAYMTHDIGVADFNADGNLDIFTTNCFSPQNLMAGDGHGHFTQMRTAMGLDHTPELPGFGEWDTPPAMEEPGLYIYAVDRYFYIQSYQAESLPPIRGSITFICRENISEARGLDFHVERHMETSGLVSRKVVFSCTQNGLLKLKPEPHLVDPITVELDDAVPLKSVFMGPDRVPPPSRHFVISSLDPHSMAWADIDADGHPDVFIGRGAMLSAPDLAPRIDALKDRLYVGKETGFKDIIDSSGIHKNGCPNRKSCWVDANGDGLLDLFYIGARGTDSALYLRKQMTPIIYEEASTAFGVNRLPHAGFCWRDFDHDGRMDLAGATENQLVIFWGSQTPGQPMTHTTLGKAATLPIRVLPCDYNRDGWSDLLFNLNDHSMSLFTNRGSRAFEATGLADMGLPTQCLAASWCDYDNDGLQDMLAIPGDLYRQTTPGHFEATGLLANLFPDLPAPPERAWISWFDMDNDGTRDVLATVRISGTVVDPPPTFTDPFRASIELRRNNATRNHWLEVDLAGPPGNRPAIGARVSVGTGATRQVQEVGDNEGSENSQGHYRLYFGLGAEASIDPVVVEWPDGTQKTLPAVKADQQLHISY